MEKYQYHGTIISEWDSDRLPKWMVKLLKDRTLHWDGGELYCRIGWDDILVNNNDWIVRKANGEVLVVPFFLVEYVDFMK